MSDVTISFLGAADTVTGSRFLITGPKSTILVDCGLFQGLKSIRQKNWDPFPVNVSTIDAVVLTHAHLDHCGYLPLLAKQGYRNPIISTHYTKSLVDVILRDSAHLQMEDAKFANKKGYSKHKVARPLYNVEDAEAALKLFSTKPYFEQIQITEDTFVTFYPAGHILGSSYIVVDNAGKKFLFTGDLGRENHPLLCAPPAPPQVDFDVVVTESTYGDRKHDTPESVFADELNAAIKRGGSILIPAFAVDRTEVILMALRELMLAKKVPPVPIYVDSPMALAALNFYREAIELNTPEIREGVSHRWANQDPFDPGQLYQALTVEESKSINNLEETSIVISASGMATGGRVVHHLANMLPNPRNTVILVGYQAAGSRGRALEEGQREIKMHGEYVPVNAHISKVESFSVHADADELLAWLKQAKKPKQAFVVHGEKSGQELMQSRLSNELGWRAIIPKPLQVFEV